jgi:hypothetical protein
MPKPSFPSIILATTMLFATAVPALAQSTTPAPAAPAAAAPPPTQKPFSFGDLMDTLVQPRHVKLALAGRAQNWVLAAYALHQLKDALTNVAVSRPRFRNQAVPELMETMTGEPIQALDQAIKANDPKQFAEAYSRLTAGCNACHQALGQPVVIKVPDASVFPDQDFEVKR